MKLEWHDFLADPDKYPQPEGRVIRCGAKGKTYTYGVEQRRGQKDVTLIVAVGPLGVRSILQKNEGAARKVAQQIEDGTYRK